MKILGTMNKAVFLDRDGVINQEPPHYAYRSDQLKLIQGSAKSINILNKNGFVVIIVTNQAGVAKGFYQEEDVILFNNLMKNKLKMYDAKIDAIYYCPHHIEGKIDKYRIDCNCRKPKPGMLKRAEKDLNIDLKLSFIIGDKQSDINAGKIVGCKTILVLTGYGKEELKNNDIKCDFVANDLYDAIKYIL